MGRPLLVLVYLALPALAILRQRGPPIERRLGGAFASMASGVLLVVAAMAVPYAARGAVPAPLAGAIGMLLLVLAAVVPWLVFARVRRSPRVVATRRLPGHA